MLSNLGPGDVLFIDEIHRIARPAEELLYMAMEDFRVDVVVGKGPGATAILLDINPFTLVGATTRAGLLTGPLRDRFGFVGQMEFYEPADLQRVLRRSAGLLGVELTDDGSAEIAGRSRGTPRIANRLLRRVRDYAEVEADGRVTREVAQAALALYDVDVLGLDRLDRAVLEALVVRFGGGPVGVSTLAVAVGEEPNTVEEVCPSSSGPVAGPHPAWPGRDRGCVASPGASAAPGRSPLGGAGGGLLGGAGGGAGGSGGAPGTPGASSEPCSAHRLRPLARNSSGRCRARPARSPAGACNRRSRAGRYRPAPHRGEMSRAERHTCRGSFPDRPARRLRRGALRAPRPAAQADAGSGAGPPGVAEHRHPGDDDQRPPRDRGRPGRETVDLEIADVVVTFARPAIMEVRSPAAAPEGGATGLDGTGFDGPANGTTGGRPADGPL